MKNKFTMLSVAFLVMCTHICTNAFALTFSCKRTPNQPPLSWPSEPFTLFLDSDSITIQLSKRDNQWIKCKDGKNSGTLNPNFKITEFQLGALVERMDTRAMYEGELRYDRKGLMNLLRDDQFTNFSCPVPEYQSSISAIYTDKSMRLLGEGGPLIVTPTGDTLPWVFYFCEKSAGL